MTLLTDDLPGTRNAATQDRSGENDAARIRHIRLAIDVAQILFVLSVWLLARGYQGIRHDARIYIGRALADLDPNGVGRDALFAFDAQTHLSIYSWLTVPVVYLFGASTAAIIITYATLLIWLAAAAWLASHMMPRGLIPAALICAATLPAVYGPFGIFSFAEPFAVPRGLAEAGVLFALAALLSGRRFSACFALLFTIVMHLPTALAGIGVVFLVLAFEAPVLWLIAAAVGAAALTAGLLHLGPARILFQSYDPAWLAILRERNPFLFESRWPAGAWSQAIVSGTTLLTAASLTQGRVRGILLAATAVAAIGVLAAFVLGELPSNMAMLQLQPWRALWLVKFLAIIMAPLCVLGLWSDKRGDSRLVLILLACAWYVIDDASLALPLGIGALVLLARRCSGFADITSRSLLWVTALSGLGLITISTFGDILVEARLLHAALDAGAAMSAQLILPLLPTLGFFVAAAAIALSIGPWPAGPEPQAAWLIALVVILLPLSLASADRRDPTRRMSDIGAGRDTLTKLLGPTPNGIVWIDSDVAPLFWTVRPSWTNGLQGTASTFSRPLAMQWDRRSRLLIASGLESEGERNPSLPSTTVDLDPAAVARGAVNVCENKDGPDAIVAPYDLTKYFPAGRVKVWRTPVRSVLSIQVQPHGFHYVELDLYSILRCGDFRLLKK